MQLQPNKNHTSVPALQFPASISSRMSGPDIFSIPNMTVMPALLPGILSTSASSKRQKTYQADSSSGSVIPRSCPPPATVVSQTALHPLGALQPSLLALQYRWAECSIRPPIGSGALLLPPSPLPPSQPADKQLTTEAAAAAAATTRHEEVLRRAIALVAEVAAEVAAGGQPAAAAAAAVLAATLGPDGRLRLPPLAGAPP